MACRKRDVFYSTAYTCSDRIFHHQKQTQSEKDGKRLRLRLFRVQRVQFLREKGSSMILSDPVLSGLRNILRRSNMKLTETKADMPGRITAVVGDDHFMNRITSIGITEGTAFQTVRNDRKMPVLVYLRETLISLNRADAERIEVEKR